MGAPFEVRTNLLLKNWLLSSVLTSRVGGYFTEYRFWVGWLLEDHAEFFGENVIFKSKKIGRSATRKRIVDQNRLFAVERLPAVRRYKADRRCLLAGCSAVVALFSSCLPSRNRCLPAGRPIYFQVKLMRLEMSGFWTPAGSSESRKPKKSCLLDR